MSNLRCEGRGYFPWHGDGCGDETPCPGCEDCEPLQCPACLGYIRSSKKPKCTCVDGFPTARTKPTHISTSEDDVAKVDNDRWVMKAFSDSMDKPAKPVDGDLSEFEWMLESLKREHAPKKFLDAIRQLAKENEKLKGHIQWMSGSPSFGPEGDAFKGWLKIRKEVFGQ